METIVRYLDAESRLRPLVIPLHPRTRESLESAGLAFESPTILTIPPLGYLDMCQLTRSAEIVLTDSGGLQREAYFHHVPCITLRDETEWVETIECGWNRLWTAESFAPRRDIPDYDNTHAAEAIISVIDRELAIGSS
jgi:UDP-GlcNAc3NAcA epimerase